MEGLDDCSGEYSIGLCNVYMAIHDVIMYLKCFPRLFCLDLLSSFYYSYSCVHAVLVILFLYFLEEFHFELYLSHFL